MSQINFKDETLDASDGVTKLLLAAEYWKEKASALLAKITEMEQQEPVAWRTFDGEGGYDYRSYEDNENYKLGWDARNPNHIGWVEPLYALPGAQPAPSLASNDVSLISEDKTQPAQSVNDVIIDDLQSQFDTEGITEHDSGDALIRLSDAIAAVEDNFAQPAPIEQDTSVRKAWARFSNELHRSPDAPYPGMSEAFEKHFSQSFTDREWRAESGVWAAAWKAAKNHGAQPAPSVPDGWLPVPEKHPTFDPVDLQLSDGSVLCGCVPQSDGDYWWEGPSGEVFIDPKYASVTHWRLAAAPEAKP